jgi:hypothetical protein
MSRRRNLEAVRGERSVDRHQPHHLHLRQGCDDPQLLALAGGKTLLYYGDKVKERALASA